VHQAHKAITLRGYMYIKGLDGNLTTQPGVFRKIHHPLRSSSQFTDDFEATNLFRSAHRDQHLTIRYFPAAKSLFKSLILSEVLLIIFNQEYDFYLSYLLLKLVT
jgi:hypothetical protein